MCIQYTAKYSCCCCWEDISDSSVLNTLHASTYASYFCRNAPAAAVTLTMYYCCTAAMSQLEEKVKELEFPLVEDADGEEYGEGTWSNAGRWTIVKALAGDEFTLIRRNKNRVRLGTFFCSVVDKRLFPNAQVVLPALSLRFVHRKNNGIPFVRASRRVPEAQPARLGFHYAAKKRSKPHPVIVAFDEGEPISGERFDHGPTHGHVPSPYSSPSASSTKGNSSPLTFSSTCDIAAVQQSYMARVTVAAGALRQK